MSTHETAISPGDPLEDAPVEFTERKRGFWPGVGRYVRVAPASIALALIIVLTAIITGTFFTPATVGGDSLQWAAGVSSTIDTALWWTPFTALFVPNDPVQVVICVVAALTLFALAERLLGTVRAIAAFLSTGIVGVIIAVFIQWGGSSLGELWATSSTIDLVLDPTVGIVGALITASAFAGTLWRRRIRVTTFAVLIMFVLYNGDSDNFYRLIAALLGLLVGAFLSSGPMRRSWRPSSHAETRNLIATVVAVTAVGPLTALLSDGGRGPLSIISAVFTLPNANETLKRCADSASAVCDRDLALVSAAGLGPIILSLVPLALLVVAAIGLHRGRRFAYILALVVNGALVALSLLVLGLGEIVITADSLDEILPSAEVLLWIVAATLAPLAVMILLIATRRQFRVRASAPAVRTFAATVVISLVVLAAVYLIVGGINLAGYVPDSSFGELLVDTLRRFVPTGFDTALGSVIVPGDPFALFVYQWVGPIFWIVFILATLRLYLSSRTSRSGADEDRFRALIRQYGGGTLGFMGTWPGNVYWFSDDGKAAVAYRVINGVAITLSDPVCAREDAHAAITDFVQFCDENSWVPVFYSFHEEYLPIFVELGWQHMSVGEETLMHPVTLDMAGKPWQKVRQALNRGTKEGITTLWTTWDELPLAMVSQISAISEQWVAEKELPEMGFTLGAMDELKDPEVKLFLAIGPDGVMQAITSWLPTYRDGAVVGWTIDFMRRADASIPGIMEFVIASAALRMQKDGVEVLSLSGAPLASKPLPPGEQAPEPTVMTRLLEFLAKTLEPAYGFSSLFRFKSKFNPTYSTIYMAYPDPVALPAIGSAIGKAYLPEASAAEYVALAKTLMIKS